MLNKQNLEETKNKLKNIVEKFEKDINNKIETLKELINDMKIYYKINVDLINNYEIKNRNFINYINSYQDIFIENLNKIINNDYISK